MRYIIRILFFWVPLRKRHVHDSEEWISIYMRENGINHSLNPDLLKALANEAFNRANERAIFSFVSYGLFTLVLTEVVEKSADIIRGIPVVDDERLAQIIKFYSN